MAKTIKEQIADAKKLLKSLDINGCIAGSSMLEEDFDTWSEIPDVDVFVYSENHLTNTITKLLDRGWKFVTAGDEWKYNRSVDHGTYKTPVNTLKVTRDDIIINVSYKNGKNKLSDVLSSFDMSIIMIGIDLRTGVKLDWRTGDGVTCEGDVLVPYDKYVAVPNPFRKQDVDMYGAEMWIRQFNRCIKYWNRGFDTRPMAQFYTRLITEVINKGQLFTTEKSESKFNEFKEVYEPLKEQMEMWLKDKEDE